MNGFWDQSNFNTENDQINLEIWSESPEIQQRIQHPKTLTELGSVGPQQAMLDSNTELHIDSKKDVLPWVPDLVGKRSGNKEGLLIFGAAYAGFIEEYSSRPACMLLSEYVRAAYLKNQGMQYFQNRFLENVVKPDSSYYGKIGSLLQSVGIKSDQIILSDLCRNSIVKRQIDKKGKRKDDSKQPSRDRASVFCKYIENTEVPKVQEWTIKRIYQSQSIHIIALGHIAEHGLLRLFDSRGAKICQKDERYNLKTWPSSLWVDKHADPDRQLRFWINNKTWWTINNGNREWRLLPIYHPAIADRYDSNYLDTKEVLKCFLS